MSPKLKVPDPQKRSHQRQVAQRWTPKLAKAGWTPVSDIFLDSYAQLQPAMTHGEAMLVVHLLRYKWDEAPPFPGLKTLASQMGITDTAVRKICRQLEKKGYLIRRARTGSTNRFRLEPLFESLEQVLEKKARRQEATAESA